MIETMCRAREIVQPQGLLLPVSDLASLLDKQSSSDDAHRVLPYKNADVRAA
jgi:hypothetical protein